jgi:ABC-type phosphate/phosphonate transport system ATPase subunit
MAEWKAMRPDRTVALVGLMGAGKSAIGRRQHAAARGAHGAVGVKLLSGHGK